MLINHDKLSQIIGKRIIGSIASESKTYPICRLFLVFDDDTWIELYGKDFQVAQGIWPGSINNAVRYAKTDSDATIYVQGQDDLDEEIMYKT